LRTTRSVATGNSPHNWAKDKGARTVRFGCAPLVRTTFPEILWRLLTQSGSRRYASLAPDSSGASNNCTGCPGIIVEIACL
jgi:hypothetical protein